MKVMNCATAIAVMASPLFADSHAQGDAAAGEVQFGRQCVACHVIQDQMGQVLAGRNARVGPNLFGVSGRAIGATQGFRYGDSVLALGEAGGIWNEANFIGYVQNPTDWLRGKLDDRRARGKMAYRVRNDQQALDIYAFLATFGDQDAMMENLAAGQDNPLNQSE